MVAGIVLVMAEMPTMRTGSKFNILSSKTAYAKYAVSDDMGRK